MAQQPHTKLFIPGPVEVSDKTFRAMCAPMVGHRGSEFKKLYAGIQPRLQELFGTKRPVFLSTSSAWGVMEGAIRNLTQKKVLNAMCGAFSDKWFDVSKRCGKQAEALQVEWGQAVKPEMVREKLSQGGFDSFTLIHGHRCVADREPKGARDAAGAGVVCRFRARDEACGGCRRPRVLFRFRRIR
jgi:aspartate aminotransferase-like enzyme